MPVWAVRLHKGGFSAYYKSTRTCWMIYRKTRTNFRTRTRGLISSIIWYRTRIRYRISSTTWCRTKIRYRISSTMCCRIKIKISLNPNHRCDWSGTTNWYEASVGFVRWKTPWCKISLSNKLILAVRIIYWCRCSFSIILIWELDAQCFVSESDVLFSRQNFGRFKVALVTKKQRTFIIGGHWMRDSSNQSVLIK